jgi:predicted Rossmann-fold nucleotide-binding protein
MERRTAAAWEEGQKRSGSTSCFRTSSCPTPCHPDLSFQFHYFALRKMHFLLRGPRGCGFPGGFGTFDELFELLTLIQCGKVRPLPILPVRARLLEPDGELRGLAEEGVISPHDLDLIHWSEEAEEAWAFVQDFYPRRETSSRDDRRATAASLRPWSPCCRGPVTLDAPFAVDVLLLVRLLLGQDRLRFRLLRPVARVRCRLGAGIVLTASPLRRERLERAAAVALRVEEGDHVGAVSGLPMPANVIFGASANALGS